MDKPALAECLSKYPLRPTGLVTDQSNGHLRPAEMVADCTMTQEQQYDELFLEHPVFDDKGWMPFHFKTVYEYQQQDPA